jgi:uncharacterized lipoprotein YmbA
MNHATRIAGLICLSTTVLTGCFKLNRGEPPQQHYVLGGSVPSEMAGASLAVPGFAIGVRRLQLASYLESPLIVVRRGSNQVEFSEFHRWGEPLGAGVNRSVAALLAAQQPVQRADVAPWPARAQYDYLVQLYLERFEGVASEDATATHGEAHLRASWEIIRQQDGVVLTRGSTDHRGPNWRIGDHDSLVTLLNGGLEVLARDIMTRLLSLAVQ